MDTGNAPQTPAAPAAPPGQARDGRGKFITTIDHDQRAAAAARMRADNPRMTYRQIAAAVGYSSGGDAWRAVQRCREAVVKAAGAELITSEAQQLDDLMAAALEVLERDHVVVSHGKVVCGPDGEPLLDDGPKLAAIREMRQIRESYRKLHGLDQPAQVALSGAVRYEVVGVDPTDLT
ncbi:hypothetical protein G3I51_23680 [Streptomyces sp. SID9944]|nr:hypothetical protein [Streptomyces sp. SID9944]